MIDYIIERYRGYAHRSAGRKLFESLYRATGNYPRKHKLACFEIYFVLMVQPLNLVPYTVLPLVTHITSVLVLIIVMRCKAHQFTVWIDICRVLVAGHENNCAFSALCKLDAIRRRSEHQRDRVSVAQRNRGLPP